MAAPTAAYVRLPDDTSNLGKKMRTLSRVVGSDTVHENFIITCYPRDILGVYYGHSGRLTVLETAHAATAGFFWLVNPIGSGVNAALRRIKFYSGPTAATAFESSPRITAERFTFTGTASGAQITPCKRDTGDDAPIMTLRTASTGMSITEGNIIRGFLVPIVMSGVGPGISNDMVWEPLGDEGETIIAPGEGIVFRQADNGTASDSRIAVVDLTWLEYSL